MKRKILVSVIALLLLASASLGSWVYDSATDKTVIADSATLDFAEADFAFAFWFKIPDNSGSVATKPLCLDAWNDTPNMEPWFYQTSAATYGGDIRPVHEADNAQEITTNFTTANVLDTTVWSHFVWQLDGNFLEMWIDGVELENDSAGNARDTYTFVTGMILGQAFDASGPYAGKLAEMVCFQRILTDLEIDKLSGTNGETATSPEDISQTSIKWYFKMFDALDTTSQVGSLSATHTNTTVDAGDHPVSYGATSQVIHYYRSQQ